MKVTINLLPWRLQKKRYEKRCFQYYILAIFLLSSVIVWAVNGYLTGLIQQQSAHYQQLIKQKKQLDLAIKQTKKRNNQCVRDARNSKFIHKIYSRRGFIVRILNFLQRTIPSDVVVSRMEWRKNKMILYCVSGGQKLHHTISINDDILLIQQSESDKKACKIQFKLRKNKI